MVRPVGAADVSFVANGVLLQKPPARAYMQDPPVEHAFLNNSQHLDYVSSWALRSLAGMSIDQAEAFLDGKEDESGGTRSQQVQLGKALEELRDANLKCAGLDCAAERLDDEIYMERPGGKAFYSSPLQLQELKGSSEGPLGSARWCKEADETESGSLVLLFTCQQCTLEELVAVK